VSSFRNHGVIKINGVPHPYSTSYTKVELLRQKRKEEGLNREGFAMACGNAEAGRSAVSKGQLIFG